MARVRRKPRLVVRRGESGLARSVKFRIGSKRTLCTAERCADVDNYKRKVIKRTPKKIVYGDVIPHTHVHRTSDCDVQVTMENTERWPQAVEGFHNRCPGTFTTNLGKVLSCPCDCHKE